MRFHIYLDRKKEWRWRFVAANGRKLADSGEGYKRKRDCFMAIARFRVSVMDAEMKVEGE